MRQIDLNLLNIFVETAELSSFSKAAASLHLQKSKVTRAIQRLEDDLKGQLFYRTTRELSLTMLGQRVFSHARPGIQDLRKSMAELDSRPGTDLEGRLRITSVEDIGVNLVTPIIAKFSERFPKVSFDLLYSLDVVDLVKDGIDIAIRVAPTSQQTLRSRRVGSVHFKFVASPKYVQQFRDVSKPEHLSRLQLILWATDGGHERVLKLSKGGHQVKIKVTPYVTVTDTSTMIQLARLGRGVAQAPSFMCGKLLESGELIEVCPGWDTFHSPLTIVTPARKKSSKLITTFMDFLAEGLEAAFHQS
ncbi:MAG: LysR family transcriptional regulator [Proteobacteria bacterium]|nr:LysR family transcriptional regulator [Pseudomonadota bacterium]